ncbi:MAG: hypothetical protein JWQ35_2324 [Bacteriovoracaceae bacterium]|nr:hypothetical protein [Bacteriovoracaceae bacterium]
MKEYVLIFGKGDELLSGISSFATENKIQSARFTGIGALKNAATGWFDTQFKVYRINQVGEPAELTSLIGNIALSDGKPVVHAHMNLGLRDGRVIGGHLIEAIVFPTVELFLTAYSTPLVKKLNKEFDLKLIDPVGYSSA